MIRIKYLLLFVIVIKSQGYLVAQTSAKQPINLVQLFELADKNNRNLKLSDYNEQISKQAILIEKKKLLPSLEASLSVSYNGDGLVLDRDFSNGINAPINDFGNSFSLEATQIIYAGGAIKNAIEAAKLNHVIAQLDTDRDKQNIRFAISAYYLDLLKNSNQEKILNQNIAQTKVLLEQIRAKCKQGLMLSNNVTRYELQLKSLELSLIKLQNATIIINNELVKAVQLDKGTIIEANSSIIEESISPHNVEYWLRLATENSPQMKQMSIRVEQSKRIEKIVKSDKLPQVFAFAANQFTGPITIEIPSINKNFNYWYVGLGVKYNIASLYKNKSKETQARLATLQTIEMNEMQTDELENDIQDAYIRYIEALKIYETELKSVELASENYTVVKNRYLNDLVLITEMLDAENSKVDAELKAANAEINIIFQHFLLKKLTGIL